MTLDTVGRVVLFLLALAAGIGTTVILLRAGTAVHIILGYGFAGLFGGVGGFGPSFITPYKEFLQVLTDLVKPGETDAAKTALLKISSGDLPASVQDAALSLMVRNPSPTLEEDLNTAAKGAKSESSRNALQGALTSYKASVLQAAAALKGPNFEALSPETRKALARPLFHLPDTKLKVVVPDAAERARLETVRGSTFRDHR